MRRNVAPRAPSAFARLHTGPVRPRSAAVSDRRDGTREGTRLRWLVAVRWASLALQAATIAIAHAVLDIALPTGELALVIAAGIASNLALAWLARRAPDDAESTVGAALLADTLLLTVLLWLTGGPSNPFGILYLVHVTLAAIASRARWTWAVVVASIAAYGLLFVTHRALPGAHGHGTGEALSGHVEGMFVAFALAACLVAFFVTRVTAALEEERARSARASRLVGLTTLAAGAAHELATPLGTIKIAAAELERALEGRDDLREAREDAQLVRREVERSRAVLDRLAAGAGESAGEQPERVAIVALARDATALLGARGARVVARALEGEVVAPRRAVAVALASLLGNAIDASPAEAVVDLEARALGDEVRFVVRDRGSGMPPETLARIGEPFFTTKPVGLGMGLGVFLARSLAEQLGGSLEHRSTPGAGTTATLTIPRRPS